MSTISSVAQYSYIYTGDVANQSLNRTEHGKASYASPPPIPHDQLNISSDGFQALQQSRANQKMVNPLDELVENGTISDEQKEAIEQALEAARLSDAQPTGTSPLAELVENGIITQEQDDAVKSAFDSTRPQGSPPNGPPQGPSPQGPPPSGEQTTFIDSINQTSSTDTSDVSLLNEQSIAQLLDRLFEEGTINDEQRGPLTAAFNELLQTVTI